MPKNRDINAALPNWTVPARPKSQSMEGRYVRLEPLTIAHAADIHSQNQASDAIWDYLPYGPFAHIKDYTDWVASIAHQTDPVFYAIKDKSTDKWSGIASFLRISPEAGSIEAGHINFSSALQRTRAASEAMFLMMGWAFDAGYRRYEWKCNAANMASRRAAQRLGLSFEGVFRQAGVVKGRNRDTAWFAAIDSEWPHIRQAFEIWLAGDNFNAQGQQITNLSDLTGSVLVARDPAC
jgi:RimJ/RimL family protein N-acetyltransferase